MCALYFNKSIRNHDTPRAFFFSPRHRLNNRNPCMRKYVMLLVKVQREAALRNFSGGHSRITLLSPSSWRVIGTYADPTNCYCSSAGIFPAPLLSMSSLKNCPFFCIAVQLQSFPYFCLNIALLIACFSFSP